MTLRELFAVHKGRITQAGAAAHIGITESALSRKLAMRPAVLGGRRFNYGEVVRLHQYLSRSGVKVTMNDLVVMCGLLADGGGRAPRP